MRLFSKLTKIKRSKKSMIRVLERSPTPDVWRSRHACGYCFTRGIPATLLAFWKQNHVSFCGKRYVAESQVVA